MASFMRGTLGFSVLAIFQIVFCAKSLRFCCSLRFADFSFFSIRFSVFVENSSIFSVLLSNVVCIRFSVLAEFFGGFAVSNIPLCPPHLFITISCSYFNNKIRNLSEANGMKVQISDKRFSLNTIQDCLANLLVANFVQGCRRINFLIRNTQGSLTLGVQHLRCLQLVWLFCSRRYHIVEFFLGPPQHVSVETF